jgi:lycopene cyclase domain-containing protein
MSLYLFLNLASISIPFLYSFEKRMHFIKHWKQVYLSIAIVSIIFIIWDVLFTSHGIWGFNSDYLVGFDILNLPIEEWLFFICIPYACIFTHYAIRYFLPNLKLNALVTKVITIILVIVLIMVVILNTDKAYTFYNFSLLLLILLYTLITKSHDLQIFYISFLVILVPFFIVNGILTGSFIENPVVWYNNEENLGIRLGTIPIEDIGYAFSLIFMNVVLFEKFKHK